jgi:hypothetical protein
MEQNSSAPCGALTQRSGIFALVVVSCFLQGDDDDFGHVEPDE